ncbi:MAG: TetR family transcriptional regulator [Polyangiaceae bacterium]
MTKGENTRSSVLDSALALASEDGLAGVTIGRLAERCGLSKSGLFAHFSSKENLQVEILKETIDRFVAQVVSPALKAARGEARVQALFDRWMSWPKEFPGGCIFAVAALELDDKPGPAREVLVASQKDWQAALATAARIAVEEGHFRSNLDVDQFAHEVYCLGYGYLAVSRLRLHPDGGPHPSRLRAPGPRCARSTPRPPPASATDPSRPAATPNRATPPRGPRRRDEP